MARVTKNKLHSKRVNKYTTLKTSEDTQTTLKTSEETQTTLKTSGGTNYTQNE